MRGDKSGVDVVEDVGPDLTDVVNFVERGDGRVAERVGACGGRVRVSTDTGCVAGDVLTHDIVLDLSGLLLGPASKFVSNGRPMRRKKLTKHLYQTNPHPFHRPRWSGGNDQFHHRSCGW